MTTVEIIERPEMGITHADFRRIFPRVIADSTEVIGDLESRVEWPDGRVLEVTVSPERIRAIALLRIPYVDIRFKFQGFDRDAREQFLGRFDRSFHKGGG